MCKIYLASRLRMVIGGQTDLEIEAATLSQLLSILIQNFPALQPLMMQENQLNAYTRIFVNNKEALDLDHSILPNDAIHIIQAMAGG